MERAMKTTSDAGGRFEFSPSQLGYYAVEVRKEGYSGGNSSQEIALTSSAPKSDVRLSLVRPGRIAGRVVDEETGKPVAGLRLRAWDAQISR
jgi:protocatechuate 3,4-dioxygenase beta subunit